MTDREKAIVMAYTGICMLEGKKLFEFYKYLEELYERPVYTHEFLTLDIKERSEKDFMELCREADRGRQTGEWISCKDRLPEDGTYIVYAPDYTGGSSSAKEYHNGIMFSKIKNGKWSIEHGYHKRPNCVWAWMLLPEPYKENNDERD